MMDDKSPWSALQREVNQGPESRTNLIEKAESTYNGKIVTFFTSFTNNRAMILDKDAEMIESLLSAEHENGKLILIINSPGGDGLAAERIVNVFRAYSNNDFEVIVPHMAKSAATMICFGATKIHMSSTSELGPVDPQASYNTGEDEIWISAEEYVRSYDKLVKSASTSKDRIEPFIQQLNRYDSRYIEQLISQQKLSEDISVSLLKSLMLKQLSEKKD